jgi:hypothetical protein
VLDRDHGRITGLDVGKPQGSALVAAPPNVNCGW